MKNIKAVFEHFGSKIEIDKKLIKTIDYYAKAFVNSSEDHIQFFGGNSIGVYPVRFKTSDRHEFLIDILDLDETDIRNEIKALPTVNEEWVRGTDVMNLACLWLAHKFRSSNLPVKEKYDGMYNSILVLNFKLITSLMAHFFPHPVSPELSQMIYDELSLKYSLKREGSWMSLLIERTEDIIKEGGIHSETILKFDDDGDIQYMVTDIQGRLRSIIKNLWEVLASIRERELKRHKTSYFQDLEGDTVIKDVSKKYSTYRDYIETVISSTENEFIKAELITVIGSLMPNMPKPLLGQSLSAFHKHYGKRDANIKKWFNLIITHCFETVLSDSKVTKKTESLADLLVYMRSLYMASKSKGDVEVMRNLGEKFIKKYVKNNNGSVIASVRSGIMLYIILRMFSKDHYG